MILTDREILAALRCKQISISPPPNADAYSSTSVDLTLGETFSTWQDVSGISIRPGAPGFKYSNLLRFQQTSTASSFTIKPRMLLLAWTAEVLEIPLCSRLAARVEGKSSMARLGVSVHITAPTIHNDFRGPVQLEMYNFGPHDIILDKGMPTCQLIFEMTFGIPEQGYGGVFQDQKPAEPTN